MAKKTRQVRILTDGNMDKLMQKVGKQFEDKHGCDMSDDQIAESIAKAIADNKIFG